mgnify:CR=1 FL=1
MVRAAAAAVAGADPQTHTLIFLEKGFDGLFILSSSIDLHLQQPTCILLLAPVLLSIVTKVVVVVVVLGCIIF